MINGKLLVALQLTILHEISSRIFSLEIYLQNHEVYFGHSEEESHKCQRVSHITCKSLSKTEMIIKFFTFFSDARKRILNKISRYMYPENWKSMTLAGIL